MSKKKDAIAENIKQNPLSWSVQVVGVLVLILNLWLASKLAPITESIVVLKNKVQAIESIGSSHISETEFHATIDPMRADISDIKQDVKTLLRSR